MPLNPFPGTSMIAHLIIITFGFVRSGVLMLVRRYSVNRTRALAENTHARELMSLRLRIPPPPAARPIPSVPPLSALTHNLKYDQRELMSLIARQDAFKRGESMK